MKEIKTYQLEKGKGRNRDNSGNRIKYQVKYTQREEELNPLRKTKTLYQKRNKQNEKFLN